MCDAEQNSAKSSRLLLSIPGFSRLTFLDTPPSADMFDRSRKGRAPKHFGGPAS